MQSQTQDFKRILEMIEQGKVSPQEGYRRLMEASQSDSVAPEFRTIELTSPSLIHHLHLQQQAPAALAAGEVQILVKAFSLNFGDLLCVKGMYPTMPEYPFTPGLEVSGVVINKGADVTSVEIGDEVIGLMGERMGGQSSVVNIPQAFVVKKPGNVSFEEACAFPIVFTTVHHVFETAKIKANDKVLIQTAAGGVGLIAVQMAKLRGAECFVTAGSQEKLDYLRDMGVEHLINYREQEFDQRVRELSGGYGVDVVINTLAGDAIQKGIDLLAPGGRYIEIAQTGLKQAAKLNLSNMIHNQTFHSIDLRRLIMQKPDLIEQYLNEMRKVLAAGTVRPTVGQSFPMSNIQQAYHCLENRKNIGKVVVVPESGDLAEQLIPAYVPGRIPEEQAPDLEGEIPSASSPSKPAESVRKEIAVIGVSCRFPGAADAEAFWNNLAQGVSSIREVPSERWSVRDFYDSDPQKLEKTYSKWGGFLDDIDRFDAHFFNMSGKEAELTDPQQRLFLEESWSALEDAGYANDSLSNRKCAVFAGVGSSDYMMNIEDGVEPQSMWGNESSVLPARISYFLNLKGPSVTINTACSSSLVAIHLACQTIHNGESEMAVAGGAFISTTPYFHIASSNAGMLSPTGRCRAFDHEADGFVPGEGVAAIVLKDLEAAVRDGDHIYGVIKGSGINQDGKTNGITAPSTLSQTELELEVYRKSGISPEEIQYVETHGTGTKLGDPIEIEALTNAFRQYTAKTQFVPIGSVKTNIGHAAAAAGAASVIKVLLAMKHRKLPPSLNYDACNPHIDMDNSPFYVNTQLSDWESRPGTARMATVSSFGFSGTNAHLVLAEAPEIASVKDEQGQMEYSFIPLSAKSSAALQQRAADLLKWLCQEGNEVTLATISYTLCKGRKHFPVRMAWIVRTVDELKQRLALVSSEQMAATSTLSKTAARRQIQSLAEEIGGSTYSGSDLFEKYSELAERYLQGSEPVWDALFVQERPRLVSMPTYPFERERYWLERHKAAPVVGTASLHPLVHANTSSLDEQQFTTVLHPSDWHIKEHRIDGTPMLPAAAYIEMALAASRLSNRETCETISNMVWQTPLRLEDGVPKNVYISLYLTEGAIDFDIWSAQEGQERIVHATGCLPLSEPSGEAVQERLALTDIRSRCTVTQRGEELYQHFAQSGFTYGVEYQTITQLHAGDAEALASLHIPETLKQQASDYLLHPSVLDGGLQAVLGTMCMDPSQKGAIYVPFSLDQLCVYQPSLVPTYAYVCQRSPFNPRLPRYEVKLAAEDGTIVASMQGLAVREIKESEIRFKSDQASYHRLVWAKTQLLHSKQEIFAETLIVFDADVDLYATVSGWWKQAIRVRPGDVFEEINSLEFRINPAEATHYTELASRLQARGERSLKVLFNSAFACSGSPSGETDIGAQLERNFYPLTWLTQSLINNMRVQSLRLLYLTPLSQTDETDTAITGWMRTVRQEQSNFLFSRIESDCSLDWGTIVLRELEDTNASPEPLVRYQNGDRLVPKLDRAMIQTSDVRDHIRNGGTYLITGGMGAVGFAVAKALAAQEHVNLSLVGRSLESSSIQARLGELRALGANATYFPCNISDKEAVRELIIAVREQFGGIQGIIHSAGVLRDGLIRNKNIADSAEVLHPKVHGTFWLDYFTKNEPLDFFVLFSSLASVFGNVGQSDYAYANAYMDAFAERRNQWQQAGERSGKTLSINWPFWLEGGMQVDPETLALMQANGLTPIDTPQGIAALFALLGESSSQYIVLGGTEAPWEASVHLEPEPSKAAPSLGDASTDQLTEKLLSFLVRILADETRTPAVKIKTNEPLEHYGIDSAMIVNMTRALERDFGILSKTLFFEYQTLEELANHFMERHKARLHAMFGTSSENRQMKTVTQAVQPSGKRQANRREHASQLASSASTDREPIAIIGMSGRYPQGETLDEFWDNLKSGKDCITEIPADRWDVSRTRNYCRWGGFLQDIDKFDSLFFQISPREAALMDPQERLFMQVVWHTLEDAGFTKARLKQARTGVYVGVMYGQYQLLGTLNAETGEGFVPSSSYSSIANRISYMLDLRGPSLAVDTMCSSSLTAIHLACQSIRSGECETAIVGGVNVSIHPYKYHLLSQGKFASTDGRCRSFGEGGDGYVPGEGIGAFMLKPLHKALQDGDRIHGVIRGSALNHGGKTNGYSVPNPNAQGDCILHALADAGVNARQIRYVEAHGTGTALGDPIEITGLVQAFGKHETQLQSCPIGSVKSNVGHLEAAAGMAGMTKILLQMKYEQLVPSLHSASLNPNIQFDQTPFYVQQGLESWGADVGTRIAAISSFGAGGSNAHVILEEWTQGQANKSMTALTGSHLFVLSAKNQDRLTEAAKQLLNYVQLHPELQPEAVAWTLQSGREAMEYRFGIVAANMRELTTRLSEFLHGTLGNGLYIGNTKQETTPLLGQGKAAQLYMQSLAAERDLEQLARFWTTGAELDWSLLYSAEKPLVVSLPGYPFAKERHWLEITNRNEMQNSPKREHDEVENKMNHLCMKESLNPQQLIVRVAQDVRRIAADILQLHEDRLDMDESLTQFGFDSVTLKELADRLGTALGIPIVPTVFFEQGDVRNLSKALVRDYGSELEMLYSSTVNNLDAFLERDTPIATSSPSSADTTFDLESTAIAVIGMSGRFPQSEDLHQFWQHLESETDLITEIPAERWNWRLFEAEGGSARWGGFIPSADAFDPRFFQISPLEAEMMDPQQRVALQTVWHAFEDAGYKPSEYSGHRVGLFIGAQFQDYLQLLHDDGEMNALIGTGNELSILVNRISYLLNFHGPSEPYNTACSSSSVAIHRAVQSIRSGESEIAVAGGISLYFAPYGMISAGRMGILSPDGRCKTLDRTANGYVKGEGVGMMVLKPLKQALADNDHIHAIIRGSSVNHGGKAQSLTAPNSEAQAALLVSAFEDANLDPDTVGYLELHGTGTELGDPTEIEGIKKAFRQLKDKRGIVSSREAYCGIGSVKTNIGHLEPASGIAGVMKVILSMNHRKLPGLLHLQEVNPFVRLDRSPFYIVRNTQEWKRLRNEQGEELPLRAGVSSFGFGGVNAHIVLEEAPASQRAKQAIRKYSPKQRVFVLSAKNEQRLREYAKQMLHFIQGQSFTDENLLQRIGENIATEIAALIGVGVEELDWHEEFAEYGLGQEELALLLQRITKRNDLTVTLAILRDHNSIACLADYLIGLTDKSSNELHTHASDAFFADMTYTLQVGREEMNARLACVSANLQELSEILGKYLQGDVQVAGLHTGHLKRTRSADSNENEAGGLKESVPFLSLEAAAVRWVAGENIDWKQAAGTEEVRRIPLPVYPFAQERYWAPKKNPGVALEEKSSLPLTLKSEVASTVEAPIRSGDNTVGELQLAHELRHVLAERLKLRPEEIEDDVELSEYGVDSMLSSIIVQVVQERYGEVIDAGSVFEYPTVRALSAYLAKEIQPQSSAPADYASPTIRKPVLPPELIPINTKGQKQTSFWIHGATGYATVFRKLSKVLGPEYRMYAFQARGTDGKTMPMMFEEMVEHYYQCIRAIQPNGPYFLGGYSFGALVAMEIAKRLNAEGETILHLVMFDTYPPSDEVNDQFYDTYDFDFLKLFLANAFLKSDENPELLITIDDLEGVPKRLQVGHLARMAKERSGTSIETDEIYNFIQGGLTVSDYAEEIYVTYRPSSYEISDVTFFKTTQGFVSEDNPFGLRGVNILKDYDYSEYWKNMVLRNVYVHTVDCDHNSILEEPNLSRVAACVKGLLDQPAEQQAVPKLFAEYARQGSDLLLQSLKQAGLLRGEARTVTKAQLLTMLELPESYSQLFNMWLDLLEDEGYVKIDNHFVEIGN